MQYLNYDQNKKNEMGLWVVHVACMGNKRGAYRVLVGKPGGKRPIARPGCKWENNIKMDP